MKKHLSLIVACVFALGAVSHINAADSAKPVTKKKKVDPNSIFHRIGGQPAINAAVDIFYKKVLADKRVNHYFEDTNMRRQHNRQKSFLGAALGGPNAYKGKDLRKAHAYLELKESDFNVIAEHLQATLVELKVDAKLIKELMTVVGTTKNGILNHPKPAK
jgi:hemoglobin